VYGKIQYSPTEQCPDELKGEIVKLKSKDGDVFEVEAEAACMSRCVKNIVLANGLDADIAFPLKKTTMAKVVEYMKYHMTMPFGSIRTPLESENLVECGATKWDSTFVTVDKDTIIELVLAASLFQISSLFFLTGAKLAVMTKDKPADKLLKDFALALDMSSDEEEHVKQKVQEAQRARWGEGYDDSLTAIACIASAISIAAEKNGVAMPEAEGGGTATSVKSYRLASWRAAVFQDWRLLAEAPEETRSDRELMLGLLPASSGSAICFASGELRSDRGLLLEAVKYQGSLLGEAAEQLRGDRAFVLEAVKLSGKALGGASEELRGSRDFVLEAARSGCGSALQGAADFLRADRELVLEAVVEDPEAFRHAAEELRNDRGFVMEVVGRSGRALQHAPPKFRADMDVVGKAVAVDDAVAAYAHSSRRLDMGRDMPWDSGAWMKEEADIQEKQGVSGGSKFVPCPNRPDISRDHELYTRKVRVQKFVMFSGMGTITPNIGQVNYLAANSLHDRMPVYSRPEVDTVTLLQGAVGGTVGMRWKAFASADQLANASPESMLQIPDECRILEMLCTKMDPPEAVAGAFLDELSRQYLLAPAAGVMQGRPVGTEAAVVPRAPAKDVMPPAAQPEKAKKEDPKGVAPVKAEASPLGGWPALATVPTPEMQLTEGARVQLVGLAAHNKLNLQVGTLLKPFKDRKWKVKMDNKQGNVLITSDHLRVLDPLITAPTAVAAESLLMPRHHSQATTEKEDAAEAMPGCKGEADEDDDEPPALENRESDDDEPPPLEDQEHDVADAMLLAGATAPFTAQFAPPPF